MQKRSSDSVKVTFFNYDVCMKRLRESANKLKKQNPHVTSVKLFGSMIRGDFIPGSDADILIVLDDDPRRNMDRIPEFQEAFTDVPIPVDIFPLTQSELEKSLQAGQFFIKSLWEEGVSLVDEVS
jgi:predicted nucleotidyltransferase